MLYNNYNCSIASASAKSIIKGGDGEFSQCDTAELQNGKETSDRECNENWQDKDDQKVVNESVHLGDREESEMVKMSELENAFHTENLFSTIDVDCTDDGSHNSDQEQLHLIRFSLTSTSRFN